MRARPGPIEHLAGVLSDVQAQLQHQRDRHLGDIGGRVRRHVADRDAAPARLVEIDDVIAGGRQGDQLEVRRPVERLLIPDHLGRDDDLDALHPLAQRLARCALVHGHVAVALEPIPTQIAGIAHIPLQHRDVHPALPPILISDKALAGPIQRNAPSCGSIRRRAAACAVMRRHAPSSSGMHRHAAVCAVKQRKAPSCGGMPRLAAACRTSIETMPCCATETGAQTKADPRCTTKAGQQAAIALYRKMMPQWPLYPTHCFDLARLF